mmetsp:Transcript_3679/g.7863  ORF Transcript_3679/g.7863 Transcript_3679/m.7863 type:complete len:921 (-) Transcript_3679:152-2914(-)
MMLADNSNLGNDSLLLQKHRRYGTIDEEEGDQQDSSETSPLVASPSRGETTPYPSSFTLFNDLTYSDDDESDDSAWEGSPMDAEASQAFLDEVQISIMAQNHNPAHGSSSPQPPMHPLARLDSENDEASILAYSISSFPGEDEGSHQSFGGNTIPYNMSCGSTGSVASAAAVIFRQASPVFGHSALSKPAFSPPQSHHFHRYQQQRHRPEMLPDEHYNGKSRREARSDEKESHKSTLSTSPNSNFHSTFQYYQVFPAKNSYPATPTPSLANDSPATSATATDTTLSPSSPPVASPNDVGIHNSKGSKYGYHKANNSSGSSRDTKLKKSSPEKNTVSKILSDEASKKIRRQKRLKKIKKAAEAREAAVQKVRGVSQFPSLNDGVDDDEENTPNGDGSKQCLPCCGKFGISKRGWEQSNDVVFAVIFLTQLMLVSIAAITFGPGALRDKIYGKFHHKDYEPPVEDYNPFAGLQSDDVIIMSPYRNHDTNTVKEFDNATKDDWSISHIDYINVIQLVCIASGYASVCSLLTLGFMMMLSKSLLHATLILTVAVSLIWTCLGIAFSSYTFIPTLGFVTLCLSFFYTMVVWQRIPFAATNLSVALKGMRSTLDIPMMGVLILGVSFLWTIWWICAFVGVFDFLNDDAGLSDDWMGVVIVFFIFSYYWTIQVIKGIAHATVAAIIGKWWSIPEDSLPICSGALRLSLYRNLTTSFGSICLGGLVIGPCILMCRVSTLFQLAQPKVIPRKGNATLPGSSSSCKRCGTSCGCKENMMCSPYSDNIISRNVNQWSFSHIGLYGYKFWESGSKASQLFEARGWTRVVSDDLILTAIFMSSMVIGGSTACLGLIVEEVDGFSFTSLHKPITTAFLICLFTGFYLSSTFLSIIEGSVSAILVNYATSPVEFHANHHILSEEMRSVWKEFWLS